jgi:Uncharacterised nucleotidyltransferase
MTWPIVELAFWNPGEPGSAAVDALLADPATPLARHGLTGVAARYAAETGAALHPAQQWWVEELTMKSLTVDGALTDVAPAFDSAGIPWFTAKGPAIAYVDYPDPSMRPYTDLDVYVPEPARAGAVAVLEDLGYAKVPQAVGPLGGLPCEYHGGRFGAVVELHGHVVDNIHRRWLPPLEEWTGHVVRTELCGVGVNVLDTDAHVALQAIHLGAGHRFQKLVLLRDLRGAATTERTVGLGAARYAEKVTALNHGLSERRAGGLRSLSAVDPRSWNEHAITLRNVAALVAPLGPVQSVVALASVRRNHSTEAQRTSLAGAGR